MEPGTLKRKRRRPRSFRCSSVVVVDEEFRHPRPAAVYDALDPDRGDLQAYVDLVVELGADRVLDVGCGAERLALALAAGGHDVVGVDPGGSVPGGGVGQVRRAPGAVDPRRPRSVPVTDRDVAVLTGDTAEAISDSGRWARTLQAIHASLRPGGHLAFETRDLAARAGEQRTRATTYRVSDVPGAGRLRTWWR